MTGTASETRSPSTTVEIDLGDGWQASQMGSRRHRRATGYPPMTHASFRTDQAIDLVGIGIPAEAMETLLDENGLPASVFGDLYGRLDPTPAVNDLLMRMWLCVGHAGPAGSLLFDGLLLQFVAAAALQGGQTKLLETPAAVGDRRIASVLDHVEAHLAAPLMVKELAEVASVSPFHFARVFRRALGRTPHDYVMHRRTERAKLMLRDTDEGLARIAFACGFASQSHMTDVFRVRVGASPAQFRSDASIGRTRAAAGSPKRTARQRKRPSSGVPSVGADPSAAAHPEPDPGRPHSRNASAGSPMPFDLPPLPYGFGDLAPTIDAETMELHHDKHHRAYVDALNKAIAGHDDLEAMSIEQLLQSLDKIPSGIRQTVRNQGGGHANHQLFWKVIKPGTQNAGPTGALAKLIDDTWGSLDGFKSKFEETGKGVFGSGWVFLCTDAKGETLQIVPRPNQDSVLIMDEPAPALFGNDVWEHAYYLSYRNRRPEYLKAWWDVLNWDYVGERLDAIAAGDMAKLGGAAK